MLHYPSQCNHKRSSECPALPDVISLQKPRTRSWPRKVIRIRLRCSALLYAAALHPADLSLVGVFVQVGIEVIPPFEKHGVADQFEPWSEFEAAVLEHCLELVLTHVLRILDFIRVAFIVDVGFDDEYVVDCMGGSACLEDSLACLGSTHSHVRPTFRHWVLCNESVSGIENHPEGFAWLESRALGRASSALLSVRLGRPRRAPSQSRRECPADASSKCLSTCLER